MGSKERKQSWKGVGLNQKKNWESKKCLDCAFFREGDTYLDHVIAPFCVKKEIELHVGNKACESYHDSENDQGGEPL